MEDCNLLTSPSLFNALGGRPTANALHLPSILRADIHIPNNIITKLSHFIQKECNNEWLPKKLFKALCGLKYF